MGEPKMGQHVDKDGSQVVLHAPQFVDSDVHDRTYSCGSWNPACAANADGVRKRCFPHRRAGRGGGARSCEPLGRVVELPCARVLRVCRRGWCTSVRTAQARKRA